MTLNDQKHLHHFLSKIPNNKDVCIIHNFYNLHNEKDVENIIKNDIFKGLSKIEEKFIGDSLS